ncbi:MAG: TIGR00730 family Rossman fold protein [Burkholderiales bacterium]|nr:TIGR00730 family Rossman fold protein [Burkholderiales bacterium]
MSDRLKVCVFCGSKTGNDPLYAKAAEELGAAIAQRGLDMVFGGGNTGLMGITSQAALNGGAEVHGIIPNVLVHVEKPGETLTKLTVTSSMSERKNTMIEEADMFVIEPGGVGTMDELFEVLTGNQIGLFSKPVGFLNVGGYYDDLMSFIEKASDAGFIPEKTKELLWISDNPIYLLLRLEQVAKALREIHRKN